jgi:hypothetical protein
VELFNLEVELASSAEEIVLDDIVVRDGSPERTGYLKLMGRRSVDIRRG